MGTVTQFPRPINWTKLRTDEAERVIRNRAKPDDTGNVVFTDHAWDRVSEREITRSDVFRILREGHCDDQPERNEKGNWQVCMTKRISGHREAGAVTVILEEEELLIIRTVQWMDMR